MHFNTSPSPISPQTSASSPSFIPDISTLVSYSLSHIVALSNSTRNIHPPGNFTYFVVDLPLIHHNPPASSTESQSFSVFSSYISLASILYIVKPTNYKQASQDNRWIEAMHKEIIALE